MLWSIDSCQNSVSADQYHLTVSRAQMLTHRGQVFFEGIRWQVTSFQMIAGSSLIFFKFIWNFVVYFCRTIKILISNWPRTRKFSQLLQAGKTVAFDFAHHDHALVTLFVQFLCCDWSKLDRWVYAENFCSIVNLVYFDSWSWQSFVSTCDVFNCLFPLDVQNEIQLLSGAFCYSWLVCLLGFVKVKNSISDGIVSVFHLAWCVRRLQSLKRYWPYLIPFRAASRMVSLSNYCIWCLFFISNLMKSSVVFAAI